MPPPVWGHNFFMEHPSVKIIPKVRDAYTSDKLDRKKAFCIRCYESFFQAELINDEAAVRAQLRTSVRDKGMIDAALWSDPTKYIVLRQENIHRHLRTCQYQLQAIKDQAHLELTTRGQLKSPSRPRTASAQQYYIDVPLGETFVPPLSFASVQANSAQLSASVSAPASLRPSPLVFGEDTLAVPFPTPSPTGSFANPPPSTDQSPSPVSAGLLLNNVYSPRSPLSISSPVLSTNPLKRPRVSSIPRQASFTLVNAAWTNSQQARFGRALARITASCGFPYRWVENPEWTNFLIEFLPLAPHISRRQLSNTFIPREVNIFRNDAKKACAGLLATLQFDGWGGINFHHFLAFMITTQKRDVHTVKVFDTSAERKTAEAVLGEIQIVINLLREEWQVTVIALTSDASGESKKARRLLLEADPSLVTPDCMAHQNALVVGDYMRVNGTALLTYAEQANNLITFLRSKTQLLALIRGIQEGIRATNPSASILTVIRPVVTRWTAFFLAYTRLLELYWVLDLLVRNNRDRLLVGNAATQRKGQEMILLIQDPTFWTGLTRITKHLEPLARSSCVLQAAHTRLDQVPIVFGSLLLEYQAMKNDYDLCGDHDSERLLDTVISSIERRWKTCDQDVYIAAIILNPELKLHPFARIPLVAPANIWVLIQRLWKRFYKTDPSNLLFIELSDYLGNRGIYSSLPDWVKDMSAAAESCGEVTDPLRLYEGVTFDPVNKPGLIKLATHILTICSNSASCERLFSMYGNTLTKHRAKLRAQQMTDQAELRLYLRDEHLKKGSEKKREPRSTTSHPQTQTSTQMQTNTTPAPTHITPAPASALETQDAEGTDPLLAEVAEASRTSALHRFNSIFNEMTQASTNMELEDHAGASSENSSNIPRSSTLVPSKIPLSTLFDFSNEHWVSRDASLAKRSLKDELELYQLLDLDAEGDPDSYDEGNDLTHPAMNHMI